MRIFTTLFAACTMTVFKHLRVLIDRIPFAEGNIGEEAILSALLQDLTACGVSDITLISNMPERSRRRHGSRVRVFADHPFRWGFLPAEVSKADLFIWGGGHMLQDRSSRLYIPYVVRNLLLARIFGTARFVYAPGLGPVLTRMGRCLSYRALKGARITVRDEASAEFLDSIRLRGAYKKTADPAFSLETPTENLHQSKHDDELIVGFAPRRHFYRRGSWLPVSWQSQKEGKNIAFERFLQETAATLDRIVEFFHAKIRLIPMDIGPNPRDDLICHRVQNYMVHRHRADILDDDPDLPEFVRRLGELDLLISSRLHGIILGMRFGLPFIGIDSDGKISEHAASIGFQDYVVRDADLDRDLLYEMASRALARKEMIRAELLRHHAVMKNRAEQNRTELRHCLESVAASQ
jgi:polysaccharide pyruvyl transferase WcaK-like protein